MKYKLIIAETNMNSYFFLNFISIKDYTNNLIHTSLYHKSLECDLILLSHNNYIISYNNVISFYLYLICQKVTQLEIRVHRLFIQNLQDKTS